MAYEVRLRRAAQQALDGLSPCEYDRVSRVISSLGQDPRPSGVRKLADSVLRRARASRHRVVYAIDDAERVVVVVRVARRREDTYRGL